MLATKEQNDDYLEEAKRWCWHARCSTSDDSLFSFYALN